MSNAIFIDTNKVENLITKAVEYEIRIWDNYNSGDISITKEEIPANDLLALQYLIDIGSDESKNVCDVVDALLEYQCGVTINGTYYSWEEIKHLFHIKDEK